MKHIRESKEPWKKLEPGARRSSRAKASEWHFQKQREKMEKEHGESPQKVVIICDKNMFLPVGLFKSFTVKVRYPLTNKEFSRRIQDAFPELKLEES